MDDCSYLVFSYCFIFQCDLWFIVVTRRFLLTVSLMYWPWLLHKTYRRIEHCEVWVVHFVCRTCSVPAAQTFRWSCCQGSPSPVQEMAEPFWGVSGQAADWGQVWCQVRTNTWQRAEIPGRVAGTGGMYCVLAMHPDPHKLALKGHIPLSTIVSWLQPDVACHQQTPEWSVVWPIFFVWPARQHFDSVLNWTFEGVGLFWPVIYRI